MNYPRIIVAGTKGGCGKTTVSLSLILGARSKGLIVSPFKKGPDYIDAGWLSIAAQNPCYNLDPFIIKRESILQSFISRFSCDIAVIEGNRGIYDGMDDKGSMSTAEVARLLKSPVILVIDCTKTTRTIAALVLGCMNFDKTIEIKGVVLNQVSSSRHEAVIRKSIENYCGIKIVGAIPRLEEGEIPERHLGLTPHQEYQDIEQVLILFKKISDEYLDVDSIVKIAQDVEPFNMATVEDIKSKSIIMPFATVKIGILKDMAFQFYYPENLEELQKLGAEIIEINSLQSQSLPEIHCLYIGGGFPETNAIKLAANEQFKMSVQEAVEKGLPVYAECGGLMFLGKAIISNGKRYLMTGVLPLEFKMNKKHQAHGYTISKVERENSFYPIGTMIQGHEFHYSSVQEFELKSPYYMALRVERGCGIKDKQDGICYKNVFATYTHIHTLGTREWALGMIKKAKEFMDKNEQ